MEGSRSVGRVSSDEDLAFLLEDRAFVDYFNVFMSLPIFGQHIFYNFIEREFQYEPTIRRKRNHVDRREVIKFLRTNKYPLFQTTCLFVEYSLCTKLREVEVDYETTNLSDNYEETEPKSIFCRNVLGHPLGMRMFREFLCGTSGEKTFRCWCDIERWRLLPEGSNSKAEMMHRVKTLYISEGGQDDILSQGKIAAFRGKLNFELIPEHDLERELIASVGCPLKHAVLDSDKGLLHLQLIMLTFLKRYWVPRYLIHLRKTVSKEAFVILKRETPFDSTAQSRQRNLRCKLMFPRIYSSKTTSSGSPTTPVFVSQDLSQMPNQCAEAEVSETSQDVKSSELLSSEEQEEEADNVEECQIDPGELLALWGGQPVSKEPIVDKQKEAHVITKGSPTEENPVKELDSWEKLNSSTSPLIESNAPFTTILPLPLTSYLAGRRRFALGRFPHIGKRMLCALASDVLAGGPYKHYLKARSFLQDVRLLEFWSDVRHFLDTDENYLDPFGIPMRKTLGKMITNKYLIQSSDQYDIFSEALKISILRSLSSKDDITLLSTAQDIITGALKESWREYLYHERRKFRKIVYREKEFDRNVVELNKESQKGGNDPLFFCNVKSPPPAEVMDSPDDPTSSDSTYSRPFSSRVTDITGFALTEDHFVRAFEFAVLCTEYGRSGMYSDTKMRPEELIDVLYSDYGSLHLVREPAVRNDFLHSLMHTPRIDIENIRVSRKVIYDAPEMIVEQEGARQRCNRLVLRRRGILIERPSRPRNLIEVLQSPIQYEFFKRFMMANKSVYPLLFWRHVEDLKESTSVRHRNHLIQLIFRKFFSKSAKQGYLLDCNDDIIHQIPTMEKIPASVLICAQASVFRSMERKWFTKYMETYPADPDQAVDTSLTTEPSVPDISEKQKVVTAPKPKRPKTKKTLHLWHGFAQLIMDFMNALKNPYEFKLLELYLKNEQEKDSKMQRVHEKGMLTSSTVAAFQTRVVLRNRLVIMNKLPMDLLFWNEVTIYKKQVDDVHNLENITKDDTNFLHMKGKAIVDCYLQSDVVPRVQVNVPTDLAANIANTLVTTGPTRGLFHDASILLFPLLYFFWKRFREEWLKNHDPEAFYKHLQSKLERKKTSTPHKDEEPPDYLHVRESKCQIVNGPLSDDESFRISFTITGGVRYMYPGAKVVGRPETKSHPEGQSRRQSRRAGKDSQLSLTNIFKESQRKSDRRQSRAMDTLYEGSVRNLDLEAEQVSIFTESPKKESEPETPIQTVDLKRRRQTRMTAQQDKAMKISMLVEEMNKGPTGSIKQRMKTFDDVVRAALTTRIQAANTEDTDSSSLSSLIIT